MKLLERYKRWKMWRQAAKSWRQAGGGTMRYRWNIAGASASFSAPDAKNIGDLLRIIEEYAKVLRAIRDGEYKVLNDGECKVSSEGETKQG